MTRNQKAIVDKGKIAMLRAWPGSKAALALFLLALVVLLSVTVASAVGIVDDGGANDAVGQNDLTRLAYDDTDPDFLDVQWSWDEPSAITGGGQAVNACAMFDTDGDGNVNYSLCVEVSEDQDPTSPTFGQLVISHPPPPDGDTWFPHWIECSDAKDDRCTQPDRLGDPVDLPAGLGATTCSVAVTATDPFDATALNGPGSDYPNDIEATCFIDTSLLPAAGTYEFVNVCSYPSAGNDGNNNPFDCVVTPGSGFLTIVKVADPDDTTQFDFTLDPASSSGETTFSITGSGIVVERIPLIKSTGQGSVGPYSLLEAVPATWQLDGATCTTSGTPTGTPSTTFPALGVTDAGLTAINIQPGLETICTFTNSIAFVPDPSLTVVKSSTTTSLSAPSTVTYSYLVTNTGNVPITGLSLFDDNVDAAPVCVSTTLTVAPDAGSTTTCTATHTFTQAELDANGSPTADSGVLFNNVTASSNEAPDATDDLSIPITQNALMTVEKSSTTTSLSAPGTVTYDYLVTNTGNVTLTGISLSDDNDNDDVSCEATTLAPGATTTCTATHTFTQAELEANGSPTADSGALYNFVTASSNEAPDATDDLSIPIEKNASITVDKSSTTTSLSAPGTVTYNYLVTNTGNVTITGLSLSDDNDNDDMVCGSSTLTVAPDAGSTTTCTATHTFTQAELEAGGTLDNTVTASSNEVPDATDDLSIPITKNASITVEKSSATTSLSAPGTVTYNYLVTNTGNVTMTGLSLSDDNDNDDMVCGSSTLTVAPDTGSTTTCTATHTFTQAELDAGGTLDNTVTASSNEAPDATDDLSIPITKNASMTVEKSSATTSLSAPGTVTYNYLVTNTGNVTITGLSLSDDNDNDDMVCGSSTLAVAPDVGSTTTCTATHTFTQAELDAGGTLDNTVTASSNETPDATDDLSIPIIQNPSLNTDKALFSNADEDGSGDVSAGDTLTYRITVTNNGTVNLTNVTVDDDLTETIDALCSTLLAPTASCFVDVLYQVTAADVTAGNIHNVGTGDSDQTPPDTDPEDVPVPTPSLSVVKSLTSNADEDGSGDVSVGDTLTYDIVATNDGTANLTGVVVSDNLTGDFTGDGVNPACADPLAPAATCTLTVNYTVTAADVTAGNIANVGTADSDQTPPTEEPEDVPVPTPSLSVVKSLTSNADEDGSGDVSVGDTLTYGIVATNDGTANLTNVTVSDDLTGDSTSCAS